MKRTVITVDGLAGSGKSTLAKLVADRIGYVHLNTGMLYRAVALIVQRAGADPENAQQVQLLLSRHQIALGLDVSGVPHVTVDGEDVTSQIYSPTISEATSRAAQLSAVRDFLLQPQREAYPGRSLVAEGRDMGTVVFPDAKIKFFIVADEQVRVARRLKQLLSGMANPTSSDRARLEAQLGVEIRERDERDANRAISPTRAASDAVVIDNSSDDLEEVVRSMVERARPRG